MNLNFSKFGGALRFGVLGALIGGSALLTAKSASAAVPFTPGDIVVYRIGDGTAALTNASTAVFLDEYNPTATGNKLVQSIALPTATTGNNKPLTAAGTSTAEGLLTLSVNGQYLVLPGYSATPGTATIANTTSAAVPRVIGRVDANGVIDTTTALTDFSSGSSPRGAASTDGSSFYGTGGGGGVRYATLGATTSIQVNNPTPAPTPASGPATNNFRGVSLYPSVGGSGTQLYVSAQSNTTRVATVGSGTPTTTGQTVTNLPGIPTTGTPVTPASPYAFVLLDLSASVAGPDTLYVADDSSTASGGGIQKYSLVNGTFVSNGILTTITTPRGLTASVSGNNVTLYATNGPTLQSVTDTSGYNATITGTPTTIATAGANTAFRGVAFAPSSGTPTATPVPLKISEFRLSGPSGTTDEFVEIYNNTNSAADVTGYTLTADTVTVTLSGTIPARGHYLVTGTGYSLGGYGTSDLAFPAGTDIPLTGSLTLKSSPSSGSTTLDVVNAGGALVPSSSTTQYSFVRRFDSGVPLDTDSDTNDFNLVDTSVTTTNSDTTGVATTLDLTGRLGAPGPQGTANTIQRNNRVTAGPFGSVPQARYATTGSSLDGLGQLSLRRTLTNNTGATATTLRLRISSITAGNSTAAPTAADIRALTSPGLTLDGQTVLPTVLEAPSSPTGAANSGGNGGGLNSSWVVTLPNGGLANGASINLELLFGIVKGGNYKVTIDVEMIP